MTEFCLGADCFSWFSRGVDYVREDRPRIPRPKSFDPGHHELRFAKRETVIVRKLSIAWNPGPGRHVSGDDFAANLPALKPCLFVGLERNRRTVLVMAHHAMLVDDANDLAVEKDGRGEGFVSECREGNTKAQRHQDTNCELHSVAATLKVNANV